MKDLAVLILLGFMFGVPATAAAISLGHQLDLLDFPKGIKTHRAPVPYLGGAAIFAVSTALMLAVGAPLLLCLGAALMWIVGFIDDVRSLPPRAKLLLQIVPASIAVMWLQLDVPFAIAAIAMGVLLVNVFNVLDGLDALAAGIAAISLVPFVSGYGWPVDAMAAIIVGCLVAFLIFNFPPARVFLGDEGSLLVGYYLWILPLSSVLVDQSPRFVVAGALTWLLPVANVVFVLATRIREGRSLFLGDRSHLYDVMNARFGLRRTLAVCWSAATLSAIATALILT